MPELIDAITELKRYGYSDDQIITYLQQQGFKPKEILDALNQAKLGKPVEEAQPSIMEEVPSPTAVPSPQMQVVPPPSTGQAPELMPSVPFSEETPAAAYPSQGYDIESIEAIAEEIVKEKWDMLKRRIGDIEDLRKQIDSKIIGIEDRLKRVELSLDKIHLLVLKRQDEQAKEIRAVGKEITLLEEAFSKILRPLSENIKKLEEISKELKK